MLNKVKKFLLLLCCLPLISAVNTPTIQITGIHGEVLINVQRRLTELAQNKSIANEPTEILGQETKEAMYPYGFFKATITIVSRNPLIVHIIPGPQMHITALSVDVIGEGTHNPAIQTILNDLPIKQGDPLNNAKYEEAKDKLFTAAQHQGYLHAKFEKSEILIDEEQYTAKIILLFDTGPLYYFGQVHFNPTYIAPELLNRYLPFKYGQPYSIDQIHALNDHLLASGYFKSIRVKPAPEKQHDVPIDINLEQRKRVSYSVGAGYGTDTGPRGLLGLHVVPVNRWGHKFNAIAQGSFEENALQAQYLIPGKNPVVDNYSINGGFTNLDYSSGHSNSGLLSLAQQHILPHYQRILSINGLHERYTYSGQDGIETSVFYPKGILTFNKSTDPLFSPSGYNITLNGLAADKAVLSKINIAQAVIDGKAAFTLDPINTRFYFHGIQGGTAIHNVYDIPLSIAPLLGGTPNLKGYSYNSIGPGKLITYGGVELQKETFKKWYLLGFYDVGDVYKPNPSAFKYDLGLGLMWVSPVGPIKVALAQPVENNLSPIKGSSPRLVINMGPDLS
jgi:translocation and assembly module TamA